MLVLRHCHRLTRFGPRSPQRPQASSAGAWCSLRLVSSSNNNDNKEQRWEHPGHAPNLRLAFAGLLAGTGAVLAYGLHDHKAEQSDVVSAQLNAQTSQLPIFSQEEVTKHRTLKDGVWVTYKGGVYDITEFVAVHPGGDKILLAAGGALEPFWALYAVHNQEYVLDMLSEYKVGELRAEDQKKQQSAASSDPHQS